MCVCVCVCVCKGTLFMTIGGSSKGEYRIPSTIVYDVVHTNDPRPPTAAPTFEVPFPTSPSNSGKMPGSVLIGGTLVAISGAGLAFFALYRR